MFQLFPQYKKRILINVGIWLAFLACFIIVFPQVSPVVLVLAAIIGTLVVMAMQYIHAIGAHNGLLYHLYSELDANGFIERYEPLLEVPVRNAQLHLMIRLHLSNAYCALGRFDDAIRLLKNTTPQKAKPEQTLIFRFSIASNLCYCAQQMNDLPTARSYLSDLLSIKKELEALQQKKPAKKRMTFSTELNEQCMAFLETGKADVEFLRKQVQDNNTQQLHRITTSLWIARVYLAENNRREAEKLLRRIVELAPDLYPGREAAKLLAALPGTPESKA